MSDPRRSGFCKKQKLEEMRLNGAVVVPGFLAGRNFFLHAALVDSFHQG
jgi:hypothetical protein